MARHRERIADAELRRIEVTVPVRDAQTVRRVAILLRGGGDEAESVRRRLRILTLPPEQWTGAELYEHVRGLAPAGDGLSLDRADLTADREIDL